VNSIFIAGSLGKDAELRQLSSGESVANFSVADGQGKDKPTIWWNCQLFGKRAESLSQYLTKGQAVAVSGSLSEREWTDKEGQTRKSLNVRVHDLALQGGRKETAAPKKSNDFDESVPF
jgi:single-strand DNA-binding protein